MDDSVTWDYVAKRELETGLGAALETELRSASGKATDVARREERCCQVYEEGLKNLNTGEVILEALMFRQWSRRMRPLHHLLPTNLPRVPLSHRGHVGLLHQFLFGPVQEEDQCLHAEGKGT